MFSSIIRSTLIAVFTLLIVSACSHTQDNQTENYIFGYGSLINSASRASTAGKPTPATPVRISKDLGYVRTWNFRSSSGFTALGLHKVEQGETSLPINGVIYKVEGTMEAFDERETGYDRLEVARDKITALFDHTLPASNSKIWVYVPQKAQPGQQGPALPDAQYPLLQSYIDICLTGALEYSTDFAEEFLKTTIGWGPYWLNDRLLARRPWVYEKQYKTIDQTLDQYAPSHTKNRLFMVNYAAKYGSHQ